MSRACSLACTHASSETPIKPSLTPRIHKQKYIILMDGFINSRALKPLNSALKSFTTVCNLLIGIYEFSLRGKTEEANLARWRHRAAFCSWWLLPPAGEKRGAFPFPLKAPFLAILGPNANTGWKVTIHVHPCQPFAQGFDTCTAADDWSERSTPCAHPLLRK